MSMQSMANVGNAVITDSLTQILHIIYAILSIVKMLTNLCVLNVS